MGATALGTVWVSYVCWNGNFLISSRPFLGTMAFSRQLSEGEGASELALWGSLRAGTCMRKGMDSGCEKGECEAAIAPDSLPGEQRQP